MSSKPPDEPIDVGYLSLPAELQQQVERDMWERAQNTDNNSDWTDEENDPIVCTYHKRFLPCRRCDEDPHQEYWSNRAEDVDRVTEYQQGGGGANGGRHVGRHRRGGDGGGGQ